MKTKILGAMLAVVVVLSLAQVAGAQGLPMGGGFGGPRGPEGRGGPGGPGGFGGRGCVATTTTPCPAYQFTFTITNVEPVLLNSSGGANSTGTVSKVTTGTIAGDPNGSTYRDIKSSGMGGWASQGGASEFIFIKNLDPSVMMDYLVNVTKSTYEQFAIHPHTPPANWQGKGPKGGPGGPNAPTRTPITDYKISDSSYTCHSAEQISSSHTVQLPGASSSTTITDNRVFCLDLKIMVEEDHSDPRFGSRTYQLSGYMSTPHVSFTPPSGFKLVERKRFDRGGRKGGDNPPPPQP